MSKRNAAIIWRSISHDDDDKGIYTAEGRWLRDDLPPGAAAWLADTTGREHACLEFICPCGCGTVHALSIRRAGLTERPSWEWDGNVEKPTLSPSIACTTPCKWHGFLKAGVFEEC